MLTITVAQLFGLRCSTVCEVFHECCSVIAEKLLPGYVEIPNGNDLKEIIEGIECCWNFPQVVGAFDGTHIPIARPSQNQSDYHNRKGYHSIIMQAVVNYRLDVWIGWLAQVHDARGLSNSTLYNKACRGCLFHDWKRNMGGVNIPLLLLADPVYPLLLWLMKPFSQYPYMSRQEKKFNYHLSHARVVVENAFEQLKGRWRCLLKKNESNTNNIPKIIQCCVVLHNICKFFGKECPDEWVVSEPPSTEGSDGTSPAASPCGVEIRDALVSYFNHSSVG